MEGNSQGLKGGGGQIGSRPSTTFNRQKGKKRGRQVGRGKSKTNQVQKESLGREGRALSKDQPGTPTDRLPKRGWMGGFQKKE